MARFWGKGLSFLAFFLLSQTFAQTPVPCSDANTFSSTYCTDACGSTATTATCNSDGNCQCDYSCPNPQVSLSLCPVTISDPMAAPVCNTQCNTSCPNGGGGVLCSNPMNANTVSCTCLCDCPVVATTTTTTTAKPSFLPAILVAAALKKKAKLSLGSFIFKLKLSALKLLPFIPFLLILLPVIPFVMAFSIIGSIVALGFAVVSQIVVG